MNRIKSAQSLHRILPLLLCVALICTGCSAAEEQEEEPTQAHEGEQETAGIVALYEEMADITAGVIEMVYTVEYSGEVIQMSLEGEADNDADYFCGDMALETGDGDTERYRIVSWKNMVYLHINELLQQANNQLGLSIPLQEDMYVEYTSPDSGISTNPPVDLLRVYSQVQDQSGESYITESIEDGFELRLSSQGFVELLTLYSAELENGNVPEDTYGGLWNERELVEELDSLAEEMDDLDSPWQCTISVTSSLDTGGYRYVITIAAPSENIAYHVDYSITPATVEVVIPSNILTEQELDDLLTGRTTLDIDLDEEFRRDMSVFIGMPREEAEQILGVGRNDYISDDIVYYDNDKLQIYYLNENTVTILRPQHESYGVYGLTLGDTLEDILATLGEPDEMTESSNDEDVIYIDYFDLDGVSCFFSLWGGIIDSIQLEIVGL